jgi:hypothetical protein
VKKVLKGIPIYPGTARCVSIYMEALPYRLVATRRDDSEDDIIKGSAYADFL